MALACHLAISFVGSYTYSFGRNFLTKKSINLRLTHFTRRVCSTPVSRSSVWGTKKQFRKVKLNTYNIEMADEKHEEILAPFRQSVKEQGDLVRKLKANNAPEIDIKKAVNELKQRKKVLEEKELSLTPNVCFDRAKMEDVLKRRFFYNISFEIYGGITGQFDFGPMGCALKSNIISLWRSFFILEEQMLEVDCTIITPETVLKTSGHVDRFADLMVKDVVSGECFRLDHLIKSALEKLCHDTKTSQEVKDECKDICNKLDGMTKDEMGAIVKKFNIKSPFTNNDLTEPIEFNLMFGTEIGPSGLIHGFLRPETAQGIFVNFERLLDFNQGKLPFAAAQIGQAFRNEISPRSGLIRVREFTLAEIEHFCHPENKNHPKFQSVSDTVMLLYSACNQMDGAAPVYLTIGEAVKSGLVANETLGYFMAKIQLFLVKIGIEPSKLRFRQHMSNEMAHYACDCWDAECLTSYGWTECVGCADRSAYDLTQHSKATGKRLRAEKILPAPKTVDVTEVVPNNKIIGKEFKKNAKIINDTFNGFDVEAINDMERKLNEEGVFLLEIGGEKFNITKDMVQVKRYQKVVHVEEFTPSVIEPSFGIGRIMYALFEHSFRMREGNEQRNYFSIPPCVAPIKCSILPLRSKDEFGTFIQKLSSDFTKLDISHKVDDGSGSVGRRYSRTDEIAIPFGITLDLDTFQEPHTATLRERDSMRQVRIPLDEIAEVVSDLSRSRLQWDKVLEKYPVFEQQESSKEQ